MQQLLQLKTEEPKDAVSPEALFELNPLNENFGQFTELRDLLSTLFTSSFLLELKEETRSLDITLDEEEKKLILKLKKKTKSKYLAKKGQVYALRKELKMTSLTLVYNYRPDYGIQNELQLITPIEPTMNVVKPLEMTQPKTMVLDAPKLLIKPPILINNPNITIILPIPEYTESLLQELPNKAYEEKFRPLTNSDTYLEVDTALNTDNYLGPEKLVRPEDLVKQYKPDLVVRTPTQNFEGQSGGVQVIKYDMPKFEDGEFIYQEIRMKATEETTVYGLLRDSGLPFKEVYSEEFNGKYIKELIDIPETADKYHEFKVNGEYVLDNLNQSEDYYRKYGTATVDKTIVKPGDEVTWVLKTARSSVCGGPVAG